MGVLDQAARYATHADPECVIARVMRSTGLELRFRRWVDTRLTPKPGQRDRTADRVAELVEAGNPEQPWLLVFEFQAQHDPDKLDITLVEAGQLRVEQRHGENRRGKYNVLVALVYLRGECPESVVNMTLPDGHGTRHAPVVWNLGTDSATDALDTLAAGATTWGILFWIPLMTGADDPSVLTRWQGQVERVENVRVRGDLVRIALVFAELAGRLIVWSDAIKEWNMIESQLVWEWTADARRESELATRREDLLLTLRARFRDPLPEEVVVLINRQDSHELLRDWFSAALRTSTLEEFITVLKR
jgi:hypothetical protein